MAPVATAPATTPIPAAVVKNTNANADVTNDMRTEAFSKSKTAFPRPPVFESKLEEREFLKFRLAQAFRLFGKMGFDEGVAGHITVRVRS